MLELIARLVAAALALAAAGFLGKPSFDLTWRVGLFVSTYSAFVFLLEKRKLRNAGVSGFVAVADAWALAVLMAQAGQLERFGFVVLAPMALAVTRDGSNPASMAPLATSALLVCSNLFGGKGMTAPILVQAGCVLGIGLMVNQRRIVVTQTLQIEPPPANPLESEPPYAYLELRENFRALRDHARELENRSRRDKMVTQLWEAAQSVTETTCGALAAKLQELTGANGLTLYAVSQIGEKMVVQAFSGHVPQDARTAAFDVPRGVGVNGIKDAMDRAVRAVRDPEVDTETRCVLLKDRGRVLGMVSLFHPNPEKLAEAADRAEEAASTTAALIRQHTEREELNRRLREAEMLYLVAGTSTGAETPTTIASRVAREIWESLRLDHLSVFFMDGFQAIQAVSHGASSRLLEAMSFGAGNGVKGWMGAGSPELFLFDAFDDQRLPKNEALRRRVGSFALIPLQFGERPFGYITAATHRVGGIDAGQLETLRVVGAELGQALARLEHGYRNSEGLATPKEFRAILDGAADGSLVYLELIRREELVESYGKPAVSYAVRKFATRMRAKLPVGGVMCRREEGDYVVYLRGMDESAARSWANDAAATASMIGITTPDGRARIPLALRAKVAKIATQVCQFSSDKVA